jgi:hypothetical protein
MVRGPRVGGCHNALLQRGHQRSLVLPSEVGSMLFAWLGDDLYRYKHHATVCPVCRELFLFEPRSLLFCTQNLCVCVCVNLPRTWLLYNLDIENTNFNVRELSWSFGISEWTRLWYCICLRHYVVGWQEPFRCCHIELAVLNTVFTIAAW